MIEVLRASAPLPELAEKLRMFGQFVGSWDAKVINYKPDGSNQIVEAEWHFGWVLEGRAIQDVWIAPKRSLRVAGENTPGDYGATIRFYDAKIDAWRSTWIGPVKGYVIPFIARQIGDEIVLEGKLESGIAVKWIFSEIKKESFRWRSLESADGWTSQNKVQEMFCHRTS
ncbi:MAG TPA: hypothetical protein VNB22_12975 [Pyrinomonadaceae bacterium]|nr:hypothetical protein [Pyrinomonadaceae bacterium]